MAALAGAVVGLCRPPVADRGRPDGTRPVASRWEALSRARPEAGATADQAHARHCAWNRSARRRADAHPLASGPPTTALARAGGKGRMEAPRARPGEARPTRAALRRRVLHVLPELGAVPP